MDHPLDDPLQDSDEDAPVKLASLLVLGLGLTALFLGFEWFWMVFAVGFAVLVPAAKILAEAGGVAGAPDGSTGDSRRESRREGRGTDAPETKQDALDTLRSRYASGELDEATFERKVERLLETETLEGARDHVAGRADRDGRDSESRDDESDSERRERDWASE